MSRRVQRAGSLLILLFMTLLGLFAMGCVITVNTNIGHHNSTDKRVTADDVDFEQGYETDISGKRR